MGETACWLDRVCADCGRVADHPGGLNGLDSERRCADCAEQHRRTMMGENGTGCTNCGATRCEAFFHACLAADFTDPGYGVVHHLVVPTYGLQHAWYAPEIEAGVADFVLSHLDRPPSDHDRRGIRAAADGPAHVRVRQPHRRPRAWNLHVGDVDRSRADRYVTTVRSWAASVATTLREHERAANDDNTPSR